MLFRTELQQDSGVSMSSTKEPVCDAKSDDFSSTSSSSEPPYALGCFEGEPTCYKCVMYVFTVGCLYCVLSTCTYIMLKR